MTNKGKDIIDDDDENDDDMSDQYEPASNTTSHKIKPTDQEIEEKVFSAKEAFDQERNKKKQMRC